MEAHELLRKYRLIRDMTQTELATKIGMTQSGYAKLERGEYKIDIEKWSQLVKALRVPYYFYDNPEEAVRQIIDNHPRFREFSEQTQQQQASMTAQQLEKTHPDFHKIISDGGFQEWINGSKIRQRLYQEADQYNFDAADELITNWKERQMISKTQEVNAEQEATRKEALKTGKGVSRASGESTAGKKIYRRADLIRLKQTDPRRYDSLADEIYQAYSEGRVK